MDRQGSVMTTYPSHNDIDEIDESRFRALSMPRVDLSRSWAHTIFFDGNDDSGSPTRLDKKREVCTTQR